MGVPVTIALLAVLMGSFPNLSLPSPPLIFSSKQSTLGEQPGQTLPTERPSSTDKSFLTEQPLSTKQLTDQPLFSPSDEKVPDPPEVADKDCTPKRRIKTEEAAYSEELVKDINVIFLTVTNDEYGAVVAKTEEIMNGKPLTEVIKNEVIFLIGTFGRYKVAIMQTKSGQREILILLPKLLQLIKVKYIVSIGMCYGMNQRKYKFGDVIVADKIMDFTHAHRGEDGTQYEVEQHQIEGTILAMFRSAHGFELERFKDCEDYVDVEVGPVAAQPSVVKNEDYKKDIQRQAPYALIGEMEGGAIVLATRHVIPRPEVIVIKGIADWGDGNKESSRKWQKFASHAAASFVHFRMTQNSEALKKEIPPATIPATTSAIPVAAQEQAFKKVVSQWDIPTEDSGLDIDERIWMPGESGSDVVKRCVEKLKETRIFPDDKGFMERVAFVMSRNGEAAFQLHTDGGIWQVSIYAFQDTLDETAHIHLPNKYQKLEDAFEIKWRGTFRVDLEIPMYSAIAARLYLSNFAEPIPPESQITKQQEYWWRFYMLKHESKRFMDQNDFKRNLNLLGLGKKNNTHTKL